MSNAKPLDVTENLTATTDAPVRYFDSSSTISPADFLATGERTSSFDKYRTPDPLPRKVTHGIPLNDNLLIKRLAVTKQTNGVHLANAQESDQAEVIAVGTGVPDTIAVGGLVTLRKNVGTGTDIKVNDDVYQIVSVFDCLLFTPRDDKAQ